MPRARLRRGRPRACCCRRPGVAVVLVDGLCALGLADPATPAGAQALSLAAMACLLDARLGAARGPLGVLAARNHPFGPISRRTPGAGRPAG